MYNNYKYIEFIKQINIEKILINNCKNIKNLRNREWYNKEETKIKNKERYKNNREKILKEKWLEYRKDIELSRRKHREYYYKKRKNKY